MKRFAGLFGALLLVAALGAPAVLAADPGSTDPGRVLMAFNGDLSVPAGEQADVVLVVSGDADIAGTVDVLTVIDGTATVHGATLDTIVVVRGTLALESGTVVEGNVRSIDATVTQAEGVQIGGDIKGLDAELFAFGAFLGPALLLFALGVFLSALVAALFLAAIAPRQVRAAERVITDEPLKAFGVGLLAVIVIPLLAIVAMITIVGAPLGFAILFGAMPLLAFVGFLVAATCTGELLLRSDPLPARPYRGALLGVILLQLIGLVPFLGGLVTAVASLLGVGAIVLLGWRAVRRPDAGEIAAPQTVHAPIGA